MTPQPWHPKGVNQMPLTKAENEAELALIREVDQVVDACVLALQIFPPDQLRRVADESYRRNPSGWLPKMVNEYLSVWR